MKKVKLVTLILLLTLLFSSCASKQEVNLSSLPEDTPVPAQMEAGMGADTAAYPLPSNYEKGFQVDENTGIFHVIESFEQNGATRYAVLSGSVEKNQYLSEQVAVTDGTTMLYEYDLRPFSLKEERKNIFISKRGISILMGLSISGLKGIAAITIGCGMIRSGRLNAAPHWKRWSWGIRVLMKRIKKSIPITERVMRVPFSGGYSSL